MFVFSRLRKKLNIKSSMNIRIDLLLNLIREKYKKFPHLEKINFLQNCGQWYPLCVTFIHVKETIYSMHLGLVLFGWLVRFYGISTFVGYLTPNPFLCSSIWNNSV